MRAETLAKTASAKTKAILVAALVVAYLVCATPVWSAITKVDVANKPDRVLITVCGDSALRMTPITPTRGNYVGFQFPCPLATKGRLAGIHSGGIYNVRISNFRPKPPVSRIVVNTNGRHYYATNWSADRKRVEISVMKTGCRLQKAEVKVKAEIQEVKGPGWPEAVSAPVTQEPTASATSTVVTKPVVATPKVEPKPVAAIRKVEPKPLVRIASADPKMMASYTPAAAEPKRWSPARNISLNFLGADINDVLKALAVQSGHNIVSSKDVTGNVTVSLNKVSIDEAMDYVAKLSGYGYTKDNETYLVASKDALGSLAGLSGEKPLVQVASVAYANPNDMMQLVKSQFPGLRVASISVALSDPAKTGAKGPTSSDTKLVFTGDAETIASAKQLVAQVDDSLKGQLVGQVSEVYRVKYVKPQDLAKTLSALVPGVMVYGAPEEGFNLQGPAAITLSTAGATVNTSASTETSDGGTKANASEKNAGTSAGSFDPNSKSRTIIIVGSSEDVEKALTLAASVDVKSPQIKIDAKITSLTESGEKKLGLNWEWDKISFVETGVNAWARNATNFAATLEALITSGDGQLLASPSLVCLEGKPGVFFVGDEVTYIQRIEVTATGQNITTDTKQVGVQLRVNGTANPDGFITLNLHPEVSVLKLSTQQGITLPIVTRRFTDHVVRVKSGQTIVIGGLIRDEDIEEMNKVPLLGDLPLLGHLFRHKHITKDHTEVVMFITATVLED